MKLFGPLIIFSFMLISACTQQKTYDQYILSGQEYLAKQAYNSAIIEFKNAIKQAPKNAEARLLLGQTYIASRDSLSAIKELEKALQYGADKEKVLLPLAEAYDQIGDSSNLLKKIQVSDRFSSALKARLLAYRAKALIRTGKKTEAKKLLEQARKLDIDAEEVRLAWAMFEGVNGKERAQLKWLQPLLEANPVVADAWSMKGDVEQRNLRFKDADEAYSQAIDARKQIHADYIKRAFARLKIGDVEGVKSDLAILDKAGAKWPMMLQIKGLLAYQQKQFKQARELFEQNLSMYPDYAPSILMLGISHFNLGNYQHAISDLERYLVDHQNNTQAVYVYAASMIKVGRLQEAVTQLEKLVASSGDDYRVLSMLGGAYISSEQLDKGISVLKKAVALKPDQAGLRLQLGSAMLNSGTGTLSLQGQQELLNAVQLDPDLIRADLILYSSYLKSRNFFKAQEIAQTLKTKKPEQSLGENLYALTLLAQKKTNEAVASLRSTLKKFPSDPLTSDNLARIYLQKGDLDMAQSVYESVLKKYPDSLKALNQLALIAARKRDSDAVIKWLTVAAEKNPQNLSAKLILASQYLRLKQVQKALSILQTASEDQKQKPGYNLLLARIKIGLKEYAHAIRLLKQLKEQQPKLAAASYMLAQVYGIQNNKEKMRQYLEDTVRVDPRQLSAQIALAKLDLLEGKSDRFKQRLNVLKQTYPDNKEVLYLSAKVDSGDKNYAKAIKTLSNLLKETSNPLIALDLARNQWQSGDRSGAISNLEILAQDNPDESQILMLLAQYYLDENRLSDAEITYKKVDKIIPHNPNVLNNLAWILQDSNPAQGLKYAQEALEYKPDNPYILDTVAMLLLKNNQPKKALETSEKAVSILPRSGEIQFNYAKILMANNKAKKAKELLKQLARNTKSHDRRQMIEAELSKI